MLTKMLRNRPGIALSLAAAVLGSRAALAQVPPASQQPQQGTDVITGITKPSVPVKLGLNQLGVVLELPVKEGQRVKQGDVLLQQDAREEQAALEALEIEATSIVRIEASKADLKVKQVQLGRLQELRKINNATASELEEAEVKVVYAEAQVKIAELEQQKAQLEAKRQKYKVEKMRLTSPVNGYVEVIETKVGEVTDPQKPIMSVVQNDPLWIEFHLPVPQAQRLNVGQSLEVKYLEETQWQRATLTYRSPVADHASDTQKIRLEMNNRANRDTGLQVQVRLPAELSPGQASPAAAAALELPRAAQP
ncbi:MAG TPA: efflux RND transporter periplasmic adaptor subunit [Tepidisphaeraceae bacterium]|nr:efflux RND transporter periplasmic adaptor subunit [Tepidisphaeraceae bacterium]